MFRAFPLLCLCACIGCNYDAEKAGFKSPILEYRGAGGTAIRAGGNFSGDGIYYSNPKTGEVYVKFRADNEVTSVYAQNAALMAQWNVGMGIQAEAIRGLSEDVKGLIGLIAARPRKAEPEASASLSPRAEMAAEIAKLMDEIVSGLGGTRAESSRSTDGTGPSPVP